MATVSPLSEELQKIAIEQINEVPERIPDDIAAFRLWIQQQAHLKARTDDQFLLSFLRGCKFSLEKAKTKLDRYYTLRTKYPELLKVTDVDDPRFRKLWRLGVMLYLPQPLNAYGPRLMIMRNGAFSSDEYNVAEFFRIAQAVQDIMLFEGDPCIITGVIAIVDLEKASAGHLFQMTPTVTKKVTALTEEGLPLRQKGLHFINAPTGSEALFNILKPLLSEKQKKRLHIHGSKSDSFYEHISKKYLPVEYGGENGCIQDIIDYWEKKFDQYREHFKEEVNYGTIESLRLGNPIKSDESFGMEGSFRKLNVD